MTASEFVVDTQEKLLVVLKGLYELTVSNQALLSAVQQKFPDLDYRKLHRDAMRSEPAQGLYDNIRKSEESLVLLRDALKGKD